MTEVFFLQKNHNSTKRDYKERHTGYNKAELSKTAKKFDFEYWDGARHQGYGGYHYDERWRTIAQALVSHYKIASGSKILDIGCGKGFLLYELKKIIPSLEVVGLDVSKYALENAKVEIKDHLIIGSAIDIPFGDNSFDLVISLNTLHNLKIFDLHKAFQEISRVMKSQSWICVESYRNEVEKENLLNWQLTCEAFYYPDEWRWIMERAGYAGDYEFIYFS
jgi:protein-L-isoaspartate(D-aspartate) O-methyltransferase